MDGLKITAIELTQDARCAVMETAVDAGYTHGFGYWGDVKQIKETELADKPGEKRIGWLMIFDREGAGDTDSTPDSRYRVGVNQEAGYIGINGEHIQQAVAKMLTDPELLKDGWSKRLLDDDGLDGPLAEAIIQVACFGRVIYG